MVREQSADAQEYEWCQEKDMDVEVDENKEELSFIPSAVSSSAGWHEPQFMCDRRMPAGRFQVLRHRVSDGGSRWSAARDKPMHRLL